MKNSLVLKAEHVFKKYRLGAIGGTTLREEIQRKTAKIMRREDPTRKIGEECRELGKEFFALNDISFDVRKGEALGIIGRNGAGKSTLLKLITRVTAPTSGEIGLNGRVASMLEVGTGFHPELTGRENIYMNGAILGMTRREIDVKIDEIIDFSEVRNFIDTPVKRYSSGMYVKLAFSVAAHLDSEIMIMDEVLAVGDMSFQNKCINRMRNAVTDEGRTVLYVSHNMNTIRQLCSRCLVLDQGRIIFDGEVEEAIKYYTEDVGNSDYEIDFSEFSTPRWITRPLIRPLYFRYEGKQDNVFRSGEHFRMLIRWKSLDDIEDLSLRFELLTADGQPQGTYLLKDFCDCIKDKTYEALIELDISNIINAKYKIRFVFYKCNEYGQQDQYGYCDEIYFEKNDSRLYSELQWLPKNWGYIVQKDPILLGITQD